MESLGAGRISGGCVYLMHYPLELGKEVERQKKKIRKQDLILAFTSDFTFSKGKDILAFLKFFVCCLFLFFF